MSKPIQTHKSITFVVRARVRACVPVHLCAHKTQVTPECVRPCEIGYMCVRAGRLALIDSPPAVTGNNNNNKVKLWPSWRRRRRCCGCSHTGFCVDALSPASAKLVAPLRRCRHFIYIVCVRARVCVCSVRREPTATCRRRRRRSRLVS